MAAQTDFHHRVLLVWATGVMGSRLLLGMHWPVRFSGRHAYLPAISYPGDSRQRNLRAAYAAS